MSRKERMKMCSSTGRVNIIDDGFDVRVAILIQVIRINVEEDI